MTETNGKHAATPMLTALELKSFAAGVERLAAQIEAGQHEDATDEQKEVATVASRALLRNSPLARTALRRLETAAQEFVALAENRQAEAMASFFGPDTA